ncbi:unnamed protein product [Tetraodon nigroviridis]|uniref:(spotted green pufferfish) hypothetical protein n=1 Tax=Tetraodon nigroviridis TaxID=99883 RepID=Q4RLT6_TETNG|nr:unnamed protein product [Tetraodon nigroviridis]
MAGRTLGPLGHWLLLHSQLRLGLRVSVRWQCSACCSACGSLWFGAAGSPGTWRCATRPPAAPRPDPPGRRLLGAPAMCVCPPAVTTRPWGGGPDSRSGWNQESSHLIAPPRDLDSRPETAARLSGLLLHLLSFHHLLRLFDCH